MTNRTAPIINPLVGIPAPLTSYTTCEHTEEQPTYGRPPHGPPVMVRCTTRAIIMPGYYRSCARHIMAQLRRSLIEYAQRTSGTNADDEDAQQVAALLQRMARLKLT